MPVATLRIELTQSLSSMTVVYMGTKDITILISSISDIATRFPYQKYILPDFLHAIDGYQIEEIDAGNVTNEITDNFLSIIRQVNAGVNKYNIIGIDSEYILPRDEHPIDVADELKMPPRCELHSVKKVIDEHILKNIAKKINNYIIAGKPVPNFAKNTRAQYKKIKNFIYSITHLILTWDEIDRVRLILTEYK